MAGYDGFDEDVEEVAGSRACDTSESLAIVNGFWCSSKRTTSATFIVADVVASPQLPLLNPSRQMLRFVRNAAGPP
jgi:hypothetical protein